MLSEPFGFLNVNKPTGMTSHDAVARIRRGLKLKKVGHAGTLDPMATGVLVICIGAATRLSEYVMQSTKRYRAQVRLGVTTDTYDAEGEVQLVRDCDHITREMVEQALQGFLGNIQQTPPMYSAIKQGGRKLYELARAGQTIERTARKVRIDALGVVDWSPPEFTLEAACGAGTYIRSLAHDVGEALGAGAHLVGLIRLASGRFKLEDAVALDRLPGDDNPLQYFIPPQTALADWPAIYLAGEEIDAVRHGRPIRMADEHTYPVVFAYSADGSLIAVLEPQHGLWRPVKVFS